MIASTAICLSVGLLFAAGAYMMMQRNAIRLVIGLILISNGANLALLAVSREPGGRLVPIVSEKMAYSGTPEDYMATPFVDPLPQALILTAIVISFGVLAFAIALVYAAYAEERTVLLGEIDDQPRPHDSHHPPAPDGPSHG